MGVRFGLERKLSAKELMVLNCAIGEDSWESLGDCKEIQPVNPKGNQCWIFTGRIVTEAETPILWPPDEKNWTHWKWLWCWERLKAGGEGDDRGWDCWMGSPTQWTWVWVNSGSWWRTGRPGVLQSMELQRVRHNWATEMKWTELNWWLTYDSVSTQGICEKKFSKIKEPVMIRDTFSYDSWLIKVKRGWS